MLAIYCWDRERTDVARPDPERQECKVPMQYTSTSHVLARVIDKMTGAVFGWWIRGKRRARVRTVSNSDIAAIIATAPPTKPPTEQVSRLSRERPPGRCQYPFRLSRRINRSYTRLFLELKVIAVLNPQRSHITRHQPGGSQLFGLCRALPDKEGEGSYLLYCHGMFQPLGPKCHAC